MSKKSKSRTPQPSRQPLPRRALVTLQDAVWLAEKKDFELAREKLETLNKQFPHQPDILYALLDVLYEQKDAPFYLVVCAELVGIEPDNPDLLLNLASSYMTNTYPVSALHTFRKFIAAYPQHERAAEVRATTVELENELPNILHDAGLTEPHAEQAAILHERSLTFLAVGESKRARQAVDELLALKPAFIAALNNSSNLSFVEGDLARATETAQRVLTLEPENLQAVSNLTRFLCLQGRVDEAQRLAVTLKTLDSARTDAEAKQMEALAILGDDAGILQLYDRAEKRGRVQAEWVSPLLFHLAGAAALRQGDETRAKKLWQRALKLAPAFEITHANLEDLKKPVGERQAPWFFPLREWTPAKTIQDLMTRVKPTIRRGDAAITQAIQRFFRDHPEVRGLIPMLLDRGDPDAREFALRLASGSDEPEMKIALRDFASSTRGPDRLRLEAAQNAMQAGFIPPGPVRFFSRGKWQEVLLLNIELHGEPSLHLRAPTQKLYEQAHRALLESEPERAEQLLRQANALEPDDPGIRHNLAVALQMQDRHAEAQALLRENHARHPDYLFSRVVLARLALQDKQLDQAQALLEPLMQKTRFHFSEFSALASAQIDLLFAQGLKEGARQWFDIWQAVSPDDPALDQYWLKFELLGRFLR